MLSIANVKVEARGRYVLVKVSLENQGASVVGPGTMLGRQTSMGGATRPVEFSNSTNILPGCTAKVSQLLSAMRELEFTGYRQSDGVIIPLSGGMLKRVSPLRSVAAKTERWWDEVLVPRYTSIVASFKVHHANTKVRHGNTWSLAEAHKRAKDRALVVGNALGSVDVEIVRWCGGVLLPRSRSIAARFGVLDGIAWMRLQIVKSAQHCDVVAARAWRSTSAELVRWRDEHLLPRSRSIAARFRELDGLAWMRLQIVKSAQHCDVVATRAWRSTSAQLVRWRDEVLLPRSRSIAARTKTLYKNGWLRSADAKQRREHRAEAERQAWESLDAEILRWWDEVLLPRTRSLAARTKTLYENGWLRSADAKQRREHHAQAERQAWESLDAEILRWWDEVLLPRSRSLAARTRETLSRSKRIR